MRSLTLTPEDLRSRRRDLGLTQEQLARELGVTASTVARWEQGIRTMPPTAVRLLSHLERERSPP